MSFFCLQPGNTNKIIIDKMEATPKNILEYLSFIEDIES
ncbi:hypothetical protein M23134_05066 [Microscilla marina ATCC 23134]|uniref:Uncharacterized protein n=1 Tax=Microscilla marina ATCC 23134 TaxID=313606 RepID=A1ZD22_MICM2|nr:hypothetical protein M23134_05066 [Microscilla marina ATCC 23134]